MKPKHMRHYKGTGNAHNRFKSDSRKLSKYEKAGGKPAGFIGFRWQSK